MDRKYYEAYDDRYRQIHSQNLQWFYDDPTPIVLQTIKDYGITQTQTILELGCGEGRDAYPLLQLGYDVCATDISEAAVRYAQKKWPQYAKNFVVLDCITETLEEKFDFIYAVAVVHMLVEDADRNAFYGFFREQLKQTGIGLICSMGDGEMERKSDIATAFDLQERIHEESGKTVKIAGTSYRAVSFDSFRRELDANGLEIIKEGFTDIQPDYWKMMFAVVKKKAY